MDILEEVNEAIQTFGRPWTMNRLWLWLKANLSELIDLVAQQAFASVPNGTDGRLYLCSVKIISPYYSARIVGKSGAVIRIIRLISNTVITSPLRGGERVTGCRTIWSTLKDHFVVMGQNQLDVLFAYQLIITIGAFFQKQFKETIRPGLGQITQRIHVNPQQVKFLLRNQGETIVKIEFETGCRIVSPKFYSEPCYFYLIGFPDQVKHALDMLITKIS